MMEYPAAEIDKIIKNMGKRKTTVLKKKGEDYCPDILVFYLIFLFRPGIFIKFHYFAVIAKLVQ